jgi:hypothetical protein
MSISILEQAYHAELRRKYSCPDGKLELEETNKPPLPNLINPPVKNTESRWDTDRREYLSRKYNIPNARLELEGFEKKPEPLNGSEWIQSKTLQNNAMNGKVKMMTCTAKWANEKFRMFIEVTK